MKEVKSWLILRELFFHLLFLGVLYAIAFSNRDVENAHRMVNYLRHEFLKVDYHPQYEPVLRGKKHSYVFENIKSIEDYWNWLENIFIIRYEKTRWIDSSTNKTRLLENSRALRTLGWPILRQLRVKNGRYSIL